MDAKAQEVEQPLDDLRPAAALAARQCVGAQQQHRPNRFAVVSWANTGGMADEQVVLQPVGVGGFDALRGEAAKAGGHAVNRLTGADQLLDRSSAGDDALARGRIERRRIAVARDVSDVVQRQVAAGQVDAVGADAVGVGAESLSHWLENMPRGAF
jgi:hypothetical protein